MLHMSLVLPSPFTGRWLVHWTHGKYGLKTLQMQFGLIKVKFYFSVDVGVREPTTKLYTMVRYKQIS